MEVESGVQRLNNQDRASRKVKAGKNVQGRPKTKTLKKVKPDKKETKRSRRTARRALLMAKVEAMTSASMVAMWKSLKALKKTSAATRGEKKALREKKVRLMAKIRAEVEREGKKAAEVKSEKAAQVEVKHTTLGQVAVAQIAAPTKHKPVPSHPTNGMGMRTLAFRPR